MNHDDIPFDHRPFDDPAHEREWLAQERALQAERLGLDPSSGDHRVRRYRLLARTLREPMPVALPEDFAQRIAARAGNTPTHEETGNSRIEFILLGLLGVALVVATAVVTAEYGRAWLPAFGPLFQAAGSAAAKWLLALGGCMAATWLLGLRPARHATH